MSSATIHSIIPDPALEAVLPKILQRMEQIAGAVFKDGFVPLVGGFADSLVEAALREISATEGSIWLTGENELIPVWNNGPDADKFVGRFSQPLSSGIISMVCHSEAPFCENEVYRHGTRDGALDSLVGKVTCSMVAVPLTFGGCVRGVMTAVKLRESGEPDPPPFEPGAIGSLATCASAMGAWLDLRILEAVLGLRRA